MADVINKHNVAPCEQLRPSSRLRSLSHSCVDDAFCVMELSIPRVMETELPKLVFEADHGLKTGVQPVLADGALGGTYFLRHPSGESINLVFKPSDEEPYAPNNPYRKIGEIGTYHKAYKGNIFPGFGMYREVIAFAIDSINAGVPPTQLAKVYHRSFKVSKSLYGGSKEGRSNAYKIGSVQAYVKDIECTAEDMGSSMFDRDDIHRIAILDIRLCNLDRHAGNLLACRSKSSYRTLKSSSNQLYLRNKYHSSFTIETAKEETVSASCPADFGKHFQENEVDLEAISPKSVAFKYRLVPIDHGYCLPHVLHLSETNFAWLYWSESAQPLSEELKENIRNIDIEADICIIKKLVGAAIPDTYLMTLRVCTMLLVHGVSEGLNLKQIGLLMVSQYNCSDMDIIDPSPLQEAVFKAIRLVLNSETKRRESDALCRKKLSSATLSIDLDCDDIFSIRNSETSIAEFNGSPTRRTQSSLRRSQSQSLSPKLKTSPMLVDLDLDIRKKHNSIPELEDLSWLPTQEHQSINEAALLFALKVNDGSDLMAALKDEILKLISTAK